MRLTKRYLSFYFIVVLTLFGFLGGANVSNELSEVRCDLETVGNTVKLIGKMLEVSVIKDEKKLDLEEKISKPYKDLLLLNMANKKVDYIFIEVYGEDKLIKTIELDRRNIRSSSLKEYIEKEKSELKKDFYNKTFMTVPKSDKKYYIYSEKFSLEKFEVEMVVASDQDSFKAEIREDLFEIEKVFVVIVLILLPLIVKLYKKIKLDMQKGVSDSLTGLYNRGIYPLVVEKIKKESESLWVIFYMDLDGLKEINDLKGHVEGDIYIKKFSVLLETVFRKSDYKIRIGGDEFIVVGCIDSAKGYEKIEERLLYESKQLNIEFSRGVLVFRGEEVEKLSDFEEKIAEVDKLMYRNKLYRKKVEMENKKST